MEVDWSNAIWELKLEKTLFEFLSLIFFVWITCIEVVVICSAVANSSWKSLKVSEPNSFLISKPNSTTKEVNLSDLFNVESDTGELRMDAEAGDKEQGVYSLLIAVSRGGERVANYSHDVSYSQDVIGHNSINLLMWAWGLLSVSFSNSSDLFAAHIMNFKIKNLSCLNVSIMIQFDINWNTFQFIRRTLPITSLIRR